MHLSMHYMLCNILGFGNAMMKLPGISHSQKSLSISADVKPQPKQKSTAFACLSQCLMSVLLQVSSKCLNSHAKPVRGLGSCSRVCAIPSLFKFDAHAGLHSEWRRQNKKHVEKGRTKCVDREGWFKRLRWNYIAANELLDIRKPHDDEKLQPISHHQRRALGVL